MEPWSCSDNIALLGFLMDFDTLSIVWYHMFIYWTLELFRQCSFCLCLYVTLELFRQYGIICFSMRLWNCSDNMALFVSLLDFGTVPRVWHYCFFSFLLDFGTVPTVWHYLFLYGTLGLLWQCGIMVFVLEFGTVPIL